jgi:hypothetical protein
MWPGMEQIQEEMDSETTLEAISGLYELSGGGSLKSFPGGIDRDTYEKARPYFIEGFTKFKDAGKGLRDYVKYLIDTFKTLIPDIGTYIAYFLGEVQGKNNYEIDLAERRRKTDNKAEGQPTTEGKNELLSDNDPKEIQGRLHEAPGGMATGTIQATDTNRGAADKSNDDRDKGRQGDEGHDKQWNSPTRSRGRGAKKVHLPEAGESSDRSNGEGRGLAVTPARIPSANFSITDDLE